MKTFKIEFTMDNDAFLSYSELEVKRILDKVSQQHEQGCAGMNIYDINGNKVGKWYITEEV